MKRSTIFLAILFLLVGCQIQTTKSTTSAPASTPITYQSNQTRYCTPEMAYSKGVKTARKGLPFDSNYGNNCANQKELVKLRSAYQMGYHAGKANKK